MQFLLWLVKKFGLVSAVLALIELAAQMIEAGIRWFHRLEVKYDHNQSKFVVQEAA